MRKTDLCALALCSIFVLAAPSVEARTVVKAADRLVQADHVLQAGSVIPATLVTPMTSDNTNTTVVAIVRQHIYDSVTGHNVLIPAGSRIIGTPAAYEGKRINVIFNRIIFPNGYSVDLPNFRGIDGIGTSGLYDQFSRHRWDQFKNIISGGILSAFISWATHRDDQKSDKDTRTAAQDATDGAIAQSLQGVNEIIKKDNDEIKATTTIRAGYQFNIMLHSDLEIQPYQERP